MLPFTIGGEVETGGAPLRDPALDHGEAFLIDRRLAELDAQVLRHPLRELRIGVAGEDAHPLEGHQSRDSLWKGVADAPRGLRARLAGTDGIARATGDAATRKMAGEEGFEPSNAGIKIRCLNQLGDSPTQLTACRYI